ncbi:hypothetical protein AB0424_20245 [Streptomyces sp. NPDC051180]|uniref:hypothetical protein n=1 Tax=Streptomyces sp. NPDC051180 TaxID=3155797 RepID=UPI00344EE43B
MNHSENVDHDAVLRARTMLLGSDRLSPAEQVEAYRVLSRVSPAAYLPKLADALTSLGCEVARAGRPERELELTAEAVDAARRIGADEPNRLQALCGALWFHQRALFAGGRRAEGLAVCEEMAEAGRIAFERGQVHSPVHAHGRLADVLAEEGRHAEAAEILGRGAAAGSPAVDFEDAVRWAAELEAAGRHGEAAVALEGSVDATRKGAEDGSCTAARLVWELTHRSGTLDAAGRPEEAEADRREALAVLARLGEAGEITTRGSGSSWVVLLALSCRAEEPAASRDAPLPPFGADRLQWSPDTRGAYFAAIPALRTEATRLAEAGRTREALSAHRRLTARSAARWDDGPRHPGLEESLRPLFDEGVALARLLTADPGALARSLTDRSMFLAAAGRYGDAHADLAEATALRAPHPIVTRA